MTCDVHMYLSFLSGGAVVAATIIGMEWLSNVVDRVQVSVTTAKARNQLIEELHEHNLELEAKIEKLESKKD
jgi:cell division protein FtsB